MIAAEIRCAGSSGPASQRSSCSRPSRASAITRCRRAGVHGVSRRSSVSCSAPAKYCDCVADSGASRTQSAAKASAQVSNAGFALAEAVRMQRIRTLMSRIRSLGRDRLAKLSKYGAALPNDDRLRTLQPLDGVPIPVDPEPGFLRRMGTSVADGELGAGDGVELRNVFD